MPRMIVPLVLALGQGTWLGVSALALAGLLQIEPAKAQDGAGPRGAPATVETPSPASRSRAEEMARDVSGAFDMFIEKGAVPASDTMPAAPNPVGAHDETAGDWLARTRRGYDDLIGRLAVPTAPNPVADAARREEILRQQRWKPPSGDATVVTVSPGDQPVAKPEILPPLPSSTPPPGEAPVADAPAGEDWLQRTYREYLDDVVGRLASGQPAPDGAISGPIAAGSPETPDDRAAAAVARRAAEASALADRMRPVMAEKAAREIAEAERRALAAAEKAGQQSKGSPAPQTAVTTAAEAQASAPVRPSDEAVDAATAAAAERIRDWQEKQERATAPQREMAASAPSPPRAPTPPANPPPGASGLGMTSAAEVGREAARRQANEARRAAREATITARRMRAEAAAERRAARAAMARDRKAARRTAHAQVRRSAHPVRGQRATYGLVPRPAPVARPSLYAARGLRAGAASRKGFRVVQRRRR